jgi:lysophospholipase L1-like esterase
VNVLVFLDDNGNGALDAGEATRVPGVQVAIGGRSAVSEAGTGRAVVSGVPVGAQTLTVVAASLPPYFQAAPPIPVGVPAGDVAVPLKLPIGTNRSYVHIAFGDSITVGDGSSDGKGYVGILQNDLRSHFGRGDIENHGVEGTRTDAGAMRLPPIESSVHPTYTIILYGTNDWNEAACRNAFPCYTVSSLHTMVQEARAVSSLPIVATIPLANPTYPNGDDRNAWVTAMNNQIRSMLAGESVPVADVEKAFLAEPGDLSNLFVDHIHPNDRGHQLIAQAFFKAITTPRGASGTSFGADGIAGPYLLLTPPRARRRVR